VKHLPVGIEFVRVLSQILLEDPTLAEIGLRISRRKVLAYI